MSEAEDITIQIDGLELAAKDWGPRDAPPVLCLHGWLDNAASFDGIAARLPGMRLLALDLPGHGHSQHHPAGFPYVFIDWVAVIHQVVESLGWPRLTLMGHSLGAAISAVWAGTFPDRVERLVLLEGLGPLTEEPEHAPRRLARAIEEERAKRGRQPTVHADADAVIERMGRSLQRLSREAAEVLLARGLKHVEGGVTWRADPRLRFASRIRLTESQVLAFLRAISCPTLVVRADAGYPFITHQGQARLRAIRDVELFELPGSHHVHLEDPEPVAAAVGRFLAPIVVPGPTNP
jgi:pimeloyl-ACP methyl ester carboxylesterase